MEIASKKLPSDLKKSHLIILEQQERIDSQENKLQEQQRIIGKIRRQHENLQHQLQCLFRNQPKQAVQMKH